MDELYNSIFTRRSVRKFEDRAVSDEMLTNLRDFISGATPLFPQLRTEFRTVAPAEVKGMFKVKAPHFLAAFSEKGEGSEANVGFMLQQVDLYLSSVGLGSCWQGGPRLARGSRDASNLEPVIILAFGVPAVDAKRKDLAEFDRRPLSELTDIKDQEDILEAARLAPSAVNNQPWRFTGHDEHISVHVARSTMMDRMNRVSGGIALCHMWLAASHQGMNVSFSRAVDQPLKGYDYVATMDLGPAFSATANDSPGRGSVPR